MRSWFIAGGFFILGIAVDSMIRHRRKESKERERQSRRMWEEETLRRAEKAHRHSIEDQREELEKIRHDFSNQLATAYYLMEQKEKTTAREMLDEMRSKVAKSREQDYCGNSVVNGVILEKAPLCREKGIDLILELELPKELGVHPIHLCSIFSNLLDNGIQAAERCEEGNRFLKVRVSGKGDYLLIKTENSALREKKELFGKKRGYGHKILQEIAEFYEGEFWTSWKDGVYMACISLLVREEKM